MNGERIAIAVGAGIASSILYEFVIKPHLSSLLGQNGASGTSQGAVGSTGGTGVNDMAMNVTTPDLHVPSGGYL